MTLYDEVNLLMEELTTAWGSVCVACENGTCTVSDGGESNVFEAATLLDALRLAMTTLEAR